MPPAAGLSISSPPSLKREPWQGQSQERSAPFHFSAHPMWGQRGAVGVSRSTAASMALSASWGRSMLLEGENTPA